MRKTFIAFLILFLPAVFLTTIKSADSPAANQLQGGKRLTIVFKSGARETITFWSGTLSNAVADFPTAANKRTYNYEPEQPTQRFGIIAIDFADVSAVFLEKI
jgi:hypothetical protein